MLTAFEERPAHLEQRSCFLNERFCFLCVASLQSIGSPAIGRCFQCHTFPRWALL